MEEVISIFGDFEKHKNNIEISIEQILCDLEAYLNKICLYGAGSAGIAFLKYLQDIGVEPVYFVDGDKKKWGSFCEGLEVISPDDITRRLGKEALVIITINTDGIHYCKSFTEALRVEGHHGVYKVLTECGVKRILDYTYFRRCYQMFQNDLYNLPSCSDIYCMIKNKDKIQYIYEKMKDDLSKEIFLKIIKFRLFDDSIKIPTISQKTQYFEYEFYDKRNDEVFIDCGAFNGNTALTFFKENAYQFERYFGFEADAVNYKELNQFIKTLPKEVRNRCFLYNKAVYDKNTVQYLYQLNGPGSFISDIGNTNVECVKIDDVLEGDKATYIKMNIEGAEIAALKGCENTIQKWMPRLAIAGYHKTWDLWEIPILILQFRKDYKIYLRSYMNHISFVFYFV